MKKTLRRILIICSCLVLLFFLLISGLACYALPRIGDPPERNRYHNTEPRVMKFKGTKKFSLFRFLCRSENAPEKEIPSVQLSEADFKQKDTFSLRWLGHSTLILELDGVRILTDPVFGNAAPVPWVVRRYMPSPLPREKMPDVDVVLISHDHYDHLEYDTIRFFRDKKCIFVTGKDVGRHLRYWGIPAERIHELGWGKSYQAGPIRFTAVESRHFSGRTWSNMDSTQWSSFVIEGTSKKIFFGGDSGYGKHFKAHGEKYGPFDLVCLEIDAWNERWPNNHSFPHEVITEYKELRGKLLLPIHWSVFDMAMHPWTESIELLLKHGKGENIITPKPGEKVDLQIPDRYRKNWWRESDKQRQAGQS